MISKFFFIFLLIFNFSCSQNKNDNYPIKSITNFNKRPYYQVKVKSSGVNFDIRINDLPVFRFFGESGGTNMEYPINTGILESGEQILTVKILPVKGRKLILPENTFSLEINKKSDAWVFDIKEKLL
ncbi:MAG TPA: hypothetical protein VF677_10910 [Flavobacterium sp.]|jgi:hypothetical protein